MRRSALLELRSGVALTVLVMLLVAVGVLRRLPGLDDGPLFIDEGESAINALSILAEGTPRDTFLGLPLFENTLIEPWPESKEYEFRDLSYSREGYGIYHGWLPLYAMAASLAAHGISPTKLSPDPALLEEQIRNRIRALRLPSVAFAALFLVALFALGRSLYGVDAGLTALTVGALMPKCVWIAQQGRYYSAALALSVLWDGQMDGHQFGGVGRPHHFDGGSCLFPLRVGHERRTSCGGQEVEGPQTHASRGQEAGEQTKVYPGDS
jgi:hypothetical protein